MTNTKNEKYTSFLHNNSLCLNVFTIPATSIAYIKGDEPHPSTITFFKSIASSGYNTSNFNSLLNITTPSTQRNLKNHLQLPSNELYFDTDKPNRSSPEEQNKGSNSPTDDLLKAQIPQIELFTEDDIDNTDNTDAFNNNGYTRKFSKTSVDFLPCNYIKGIKKDEDTYNQINNKKDRIDSPYLFSYKKFHPLSFLTGHYKGFLNKKGFLDYPSPLLIDTETWMNPPDLRKTGILRGMEISNENGLVLIDPVICKRFRGIIKSVLAQFIKCTFTGKKMSLPIKLFEPKSFLQVIAEYWYYLPKFMKQARKKEITPIERLKTIMAFAISGLYIPTKQLKGFNPLIGETFQGDFMIDDESMKVYLEQVSNYPTVSRFYVVGKGFELYGLLDIGMKNESMGNKITITLKGYLCVEFKELGEKIYFLMPSVRVLNGASEKNRSAFFVSNMVFADVKNGLKGLVKLGTNKKVIHGVEGGIFKCNYTKDYKFEYDKENNECDKLKMKTINFISKIKGSWLGKVYFDDVLYWDIDQEVPTYIRPVKHCLPSDGRFREDLIWLYRAFHFAKDKEEAERYEDYAQEWKLNVERLQREERDIRAKNNKKLLKQ